MLTFVGLGLWDVKDISVKGLEAVREADEVYVEFYTSKLLSSIEEMEEFFGKRVVELERIDLEENSFRLIERAKSKSVVLLVPGDPMVATTHSAIKLEAERKGVKTRIIHGASISTAVCGLTGLHNYRFGKSATVSWHRSQTPVNVIKANRSIDAHTLLFLDLHPEPMTIGHAVENLIAEDAQMKDLYAVGIARAGSGEEVVKCDRLENLKKIDFGKPLHVMVVLAKTLHFMEFECLREFADAPAELERLVA
ncbi:MAG: Diphthine synthase [Archaeoglobus fulgidus]|uniref:Diphthine synthase n=1 Tax=Archaeoglobus fulgidus TaxID=2234 RepID=A0A101DY45_ARCFL|nr:MAG: Diphthine synthase [Archaeoglobus fulgidus]